MTWTIPPRSDGPSGLALSASGEGPPLVLIHGVGLRSECWARQIPALARHFTVLAVDLPGHGESAALTGLPTLGDFTSRMAEVVEGLGVPAVIAGHSLGALIALEIAFKSPHLCAGVAALNAIFRRSPDAAELVRERARTLPADQVSDPSQTLRRWFDADPALDAEAACRAWLLSAAPAAYKAAYRVFADTDGPDAEGLRELSCPALFLTGALEPNSTPAMSDAMAELAPFGKARIVDGAAHMMPMTHPGVVTAALVEFADECFGGRP